MRVSALGFGASPLGGLYGAIDETECIRTVRTALELGVNFIDVAPFYGAAKAEAVLGKALHGVERSSYILATKVGRYGENHFDFSPARVTRSVDESLSRLGCGHVDVIQCHDVEFADLRQVVEETIPALERLRDTGKVRYIGITGYPLETLAYVGFRTRVDTVLSYCRYTLLDRGLLRWTPQFQARGIAVINASPLAMGLLTHGGPPMWHPAPVRLRECARKTAQLCRRRGVDVAQVALRFAIAPPEFATTVVGSASVATMTRNVRWAAEPLDEDLVTEIEELVSPVLNISWRTGRPENDDVTTGQTTSIHLT